MRVWLLLLFLTMSSVAYAVDTEIFDDWVATGETISVDNSDYTIHYDSISKEIVVRSDADATVVDYESCETLDLLSFCFEETESTHDNIQEIRLVIYRIENQIALTRTMSASSFELGEKYKAETLIDNTGSETVNDIVFRDALPDGMEITDVSGCDRDGQAIIWTGKLKGGADHDCSYEFIPRKLGSHKTLARVSYFDGYQTQTVYSSAITIDPTSHVELTINANDTRIEPGEKIEVWFNISNIAEKSLTTKNLTVIVPSTLRILDQSDDWSGTSQNLYWESEKILSGDNEGLMIKLRPEFTGTYKILVRLTYDYKGYVYETLLHSQAITVDEKEPEITTEPENGQTISGSESVEFRISVENTYSHMNLTDINTSVTTDLLYVSDTYLDVIEPNGLRRAVDLDFIPPQLESTKNYKVIVNVTGTTEFGELFSEKKEFTIRVSPTDTLSIALTATPTLVEEGDTITVKAQVKNPNEISYTDVRVSDTTDGVVKKGKTSASISELPGKTTETAYEFQIIAPDVTSEMNLTIGSVLEYDDEGTPRFVEAERIVLVKPRALKLSATIKSDTSVKRGELTPITLSITNNDDVTARDVSLTLEGSSDFMIAGDLNHKIGELDPGETVTIDDVAFIIPVYADTKTFPSQNLTFSDDDGNAFYSETNSIKIKASDNKVTIPLLVLTHTTGDETTVTVQNIGSEEAEVNLVDGELNVSFLLIPDQTETFTSDMISSPVVSFDTALYRVFAFPSYVAEASEEEEIPEESGAPVTERLEEDPVEPEEHVPIMPELSEPVLQEENDTVIEDFAENTEKTWKSKLVSIFKLIKKILFWQRSSDTGDMG